MEKANQQKHEAAGRTFQRKINTGARPTLPLLLPIYFVWDPSPWDGAAHIQGATPILS